MIRGFVCSSFDLLHAGHILMLKQCKKWCDYLVVGLQVNPQLERKEKNKPVESLLERQIKLNACNYVDQIIVYETEKELEVILNVFEFSVRFLGEDYKDGSKPITAKYACPICYISRKHEYSSTELRERIKNA